MTPPHRTAMLEPVARVLPYCWAMDSAAVARRLGTFSHPTGRAGPASAWASAVGGGVTSGAAASTTASAVTGSASVLEHATAAANAIDMAVTSAVRQTAS